MHIPLDKARNLWYNFNVCFNIKIFMNTKLKKLLASKSPREGKSCCSGCTKWFCDGCAMGICKCK